MKIIFVDPLDENEKFWWPAIIVEKDDYIAFCVDIGIEIKLEEDILVCYFEDGSHSCVKHEDTLTLEIYFNKIGLQSLLKDENEMNLDEETIKWLGTRTMKNVLKAFKEDKIPSKFKWYKKKKKINNDDTSNNSYWKDIIYKKATQFYKKQ